MSKAKTPVAILVRVSTVKQETARQVSELRAYAQSKEPKSQRVKGNSNSLIHRQQGVSEITEGES